MAQNPLAVLAAMLGGGFTGYAGDLRQRHEQDQDRQRMALENSRFNENVRQFNAELGENTRQFDARQAQDESQFGRTHDLNRDQFLHGQEFDWAKLWSQEREAERDRAASLRNTNIMYGPGNRDQRQQDAQGLGYMEMLRHGINGTPRTQVQQDALNQIGLMMGAGNLTAAQAANGWANSLRYPPGYYQRVDPNDPSSVGQNGLIPSFLLGNNGTPADSSNQFNGNEFRRKLEEERRKRAANNPTR